MAFSAMPPCFLRFTVDIYVHYVLSVTQLIAPHPAKANNVGFKNELRVRIIKDTDFGESISYVSNAPLCFLQYLL